MRTDGEIQQDVLDELTWDAAIGARNLGATVVAGVVTITGQVSAYAEKREAERLTEMIPGVRTDELGECAQPWRMKTSPTCQMQTRPGKTDVWPAPTKVKAVRP